MSTINVNLMADSQGGSVAPISSVMRNRIINGAMVISQYNDTSSTTPAGDGYFIDRYRTVFTGSTKFTVGQNLNSVTPPVGFVNYLGLQVATAGSILAGDINSFAQVIEGVNVFDLEWGTANAKTVNLSFQVYSNITGTFGGALQNSAQNRSYPFTYIISSANTWTTVSVTISGDTSGTWLKTTGVGIRVFWSLGTGSTYSGTAGAWAGANYFSATGATTIMASTSNVFYITGVQLEKGTQATGFEYRQIGAELQLCQRYFQKAPITYGAAINTTTLGTCYDFPVVMRANPTLALLTTTPYAEIPLTTGFTASGATVAGYSYAGGTGLTVTGFTGFTTGRAPILLDNNQVSVSAEL